MTVLIFLIILVVLILVHEAGHFVMAKISGMRVDEFGIGFPPRLFAKKIGETEYSVNALPFGGFVKIYGEDGTDEDLPEPRAFNKRPRILQALVLVAGISMNLILAWIIFSAILFIGTPHMLSSEEIVKAPDASLIVSGVLPGSPADKAGISTGDTIVSIQSDHGSFQNADPALFTKYVTTGKPTDVLVIQVRHATQKEESVFITPATHVVPSDPSRLALGVSVGAIGTVPVSWYEAPIEGAKLAYGVTLATATELGKFLGHAVTFSVNLSQVSGPIGIVGAVGSARADGFTALLSLAALISINLAIVNLIPIPALDGGRLLFVIIEGIIRRPIRPRISRAVNSIGFALLILLMVVVTAHDLFKLFT